MMTKDQEKGSAAVILLSAVAGGAMLLALEGRSVRVNNKLSEQARRKAVELAEKDNLSAISYLHASLEYSPSSSPVLNINGRSIQGGGNGSIAAQNGMGYFSRPNFDGAPVNDIQKLFKGNWNIRPTSVQKTTLQVVDEKVVPYQYAEYVVKATSMAMDRGRQVFPVESMSRIKVALPPPPPPPPPPPSPPAASYSSVSYRSTPSVSVSSRSSSRSSSSRSSSSSGGCR